MEILRAKRERDWFCGEPRHKYIVRTEVGTFSIQRQGGPHPWIVYFNGQWMGGAYTQNRRFYTKRDAITKISEEVEYRLDLVNGRDNSKAGGKK
jgi:hypothetical protein|tara:strand:- start:266 stop:547 length:282 start_codon:yes stop_codon:yes gene_type:complete